MPGKRFLPLLLGVLWASIQVLPERFRWELAKTFNTVCNFFQAAFITIILTVIGPSRTSAHPGTGDRVSMLGSPDIDASHRCLTPLHRWRRPAWRWSWTPRRRTP